MEESLAEMLTNYKNNDVDDTDTEGEETQMTEAVETVVENKAEETVVENSINIISFTEWIEKNNTSFGPTSDVAKVKIAVTDVDSGASIGFKAPSLKGEKDTDGKVKKDLFFIKEINNISVLDLPLFHLKFYKGDLFRVIHQYSETVFIKEYSVKTGSVLIFCTPFENHLIPYAKMKVKKGEKVISAILPDLTKINEKMNGSGDMEALQLMYKQSIKFKDKLTNMKEIAEWILKRYEDAIDVNHQIQIDGVMINQVG